MKVGMEISHNIMQVLLLMQGRLLQMHKEEDFGIVQIHQGYGVMQNHCHLHQRGFISIRGSGKSACSSGGFPLLKNGSLSNYVLIAQDDLNTLGYSTGGLDGIFGRRTYEAVRAYQSKVGLTVDRNCGM